jgi:hypothetical protein
LLLDEQGKEEQRRPKHVGRRKRSGNHTSRGAYKNRFTKKNSHENVQVLLLNRKEYRKKKKLKKMIILIIGTS